MYPTWNIFLVLQLKIIINITKKKYLSINFIDFNWANIFFQVLITLIGVLLANSAPEPTDWMNETHRQSNNKSLNKNSQDW